MSKRSLGIYSTAFLALCFLSTAFVAQQPRNRNTPAQPVNNLKLRYKTTANGQTTESSTLIRGSRERTEMKFGPGMEIISITQCDLKRTVQISEAAQKYVVTPMDLSAATTTAAGTGSSMSAGEPVTRGGVVTYTTTSTDTGERRDMFGFKARHVKIVTTITSSPDACTPINQKIERDGWYIDFSYGLNCEFNRSQMMGAPSAGGGCRDRYQFKQLGTGKDGYPLIETMTMYGPNGQAMFTSSKEVIELSREPLDAALFDVPSGYTETTNMQELYMPATTASMDQPESRQQYPISGRKEAPPTEPARIRVGVVQLNNRSGKDISIEMLRQRLIGNIDDSSIEAVSLNALTATDAEIEAKAKGCTFILYTDIATLKSSKVGGMFGRVTGVSGAGKTESKLEFKLVALSDKSTRLQSSASAKEEGDDASAGTAIDQEANMVKAAVMKG
jgi:hypothetical protein